MTCEHCVLSVSEAVSDVARVAQVDVNLASGRLAVRGAKFRGEEIRTAVAEAGYEVVA